MDSFISTFCSVEIYCQTSKDEMANSLETKGIQTVMCIVPGWNIYKCYACDAFYSMTKHSVIILQGCVYFPPVLLAAE